MPPRMLRDGQKRLAYRKPGTDAIHPEYEYFEVIKETKNLYTIEVKNYEKKIGEHVFTENGTIRISKVSGRELHPNSEEHACVIHAYGRYYNEDGTHYEID